MPETVKPLPPPGQPLVTTPATQPDAKGGSTSEFKLGLFVTVAGAIVAGLTTTLTALRADPGLSDAAWIAIGLTILGVLGSGAKIAGDYARGRSVVKAALINRDTAELLADKAAASRPS